MKGQCWIIEDCGCHYALIGRLIIICWFSCYYLISVTARLNSDVLNSAKFSRRGAVCNEITSWPIVGLELPMIIYLHVRTSNFKMLPAEEFRFV